MVRSLRGRRRRSRLRTVALIGIDGSGKTTQAHRLADALSAAGRPATYHRNAGGRRWLGRLAQQLGRPDAQRLVGRDGLLAVESVLRWLAIAAALLSCLLTGRTAVMDRYAACQYASIRAHGGHRWERLARAGYRVFPRPQVTFLLAVDPAEAYRRIERRGTDHETMGWLTAADTAYRALPEYPTFVLVDAGRPAEEVSQQIQRHLAGWLPSDDAEEPAGVADRAAADTAAGADAAPPRPAVPNLGPAPGAVMPLAAQARP
ncbi:dTMP kinase [Micromonospora sp. WMMD812]|uniref:dTMP kinase n=1 Tax=Micromonospora sp. WMMD812 TaxID=3015152 RepID=UPI00248D1A0E|nr:dTMP kinase [Micromonospora sp. WMMD812]WBB66782.1 dTMP kinase [Micromonospora sp. WMMD812]